MRWSLNARHTSCYYESELRITPRERAFIQGNFPCNLSRNVGKEIHCKLQETHHPLHSRAQLATRVQTKNALSRSHVQSVKQISLEKKNETELHTELENRL